MSAEADGIFAGKRLVIFGCGYLGSEVARQAVGRGLRVTALTRNPATAAALGRLGVETIVAELAGDTWHAQVAEPVDFVLNCVSAGGGGAEGYRRSYVGGMRSVLTWARDTGSPGTLVYTGSTAVYSQDGGVLVDESCPEAGSDERSALLLETENLLRGAEGACGRWLVLRLAGIYGPGRHRLLDQVRTGEVSGDGDPHLNLIYRDDAVAAVWAALGAPADVADQVFNVADEGAATKGEIVAWLAERLGVALPRFTGLPAGARRMVAPDRIIVSTRAKQELGWRPRHRTFREGYAEILRAL
jgi:nucleoside-diphosphate-sugar epimerase